MEQSAAFITRYGLYNLLKDDMKDFFCSQEAEIATPSPDLSYVPYTGTNFSIVILIYLQKYLLLQRSRVPGQQWPVGWTPPTCTGGQGTRAAQVKTSLFLHY